MARKRRLVPWIDWHANGTAYANWYDAKDGRTKRISLATKDVGEAQARFAAFLTGGHEIREPSRLAGLTVSQALDDYYREHVCEKVIDRGRQEIAIKHLKAWFKDTLISDVDIPACRAYRDARRSGQISGNTYHQFVGAKVGDSTIRRELLTIGAAARHAAKWKRLKRSQLPEVELPSENDGGDQKISDNDWLTKSEYARAVSMATGRLKQFIILAYETGARRASIERLTYKQVNLKTGLLNLQRPDATNLERASKKRRPVVRITAEMRPVLEDLLLDRDPTQPLLFGPDNRTGPRNDPTWRPEPNFYEPFRFHMERIGLGHKRNPHILRHSRATHLLMDGEPIFSVAKLLGDSTATVERVYGHYCPSYGAAIEGVKR